MIAQLVRALDGARTPQRWQTGTAAATARLYELRIRSAWLGPLGQPPPSLHGGPLFGRALADAVARLGMRDEHADEGSAPRNAGAMHPPGPRTRPADATRNSKTASRAVLPPASVWARGRAADTQTFADAADVAASPEHSAGVESARRVVNGASAHAPRALERFAPRQLLERLSRNARVVATTAVVPREGRSPTSPTAPAPRTAGAQSSSGVAQRSRRSPPNSVTSARLPVPALDGSRGYGPSRAFDAPSAAPNPAGFPGGLGGIRAGVDAAAAATASLRAHMLDRARERRPRALSAFGEHAIERDWSRSMLGPVAPATLLEQLAAAPRDGFVPATPAARREAAHHGAIRRDRTSRAPANPPSDPPELAAVDALEPPTEIPSPSTTTPPFADVSRANAARSLERAPTVPPLPPFAWPHSSAERALAVAALSGSRRVPSPATDDDRDLDLLSAKIERILAEQARRHGIDV